MGDSSQLQGAIPAAGDNRFLCVPLLRASRAHASKSRRHAGVFGALLGSMIVFKVADSLGRRRELLIGAAFYLIASLIEAAAANGSWDFTTGVSVLLLGRVLYGLGCGFSMHGAPAYST